MRRVWHATPPYVVTWTMPGAIAESGRDDILFEHGGR